jgi:NUMOD4 motif
MNEVRRPIPGFENYDITNYGDIINVHTNRVMKRSPTLLGEMTVGLVRDGYQYRRSVKVLVARAFVKGETELFDTPILLDGNRNNIRADNIMWRPRWFAWKYTHQFHELEDWYYLGPVIELLSFKEYDSCIHAAISNGVLCVDVRKSIYNEAPVWPTGQHFGWLQ